MSSTVKFTTIDEAKGEWIVESKLKKDIITPGKGGPHPPSNSNVVVHYTGTLADGSVFDSSRSRNDPFKFVIGKGQVIKGWDSGVASMTVGERAILYCAPEYAYGASGSPPKIPANATLAFDVELISFDDRVEVAGKSVVKRLLTSGEGYSKPNDFARVTVDISIAVGNTDMPAPTDVVVSAKSLTFNLTSDWRVIDGVSEAIKSMLKGEHAVVTIQPDYAYGSKGYQPNNKTADNDTSTFPLPSSAIPPNAILAADITLIDFERAKDSWALSLSEKSALADEYKSAGNNAFKAGAFKKAKDLYSRTLTTLPKSGTAQPDDSSDDEGDANMTKSAPSDSKADAALRLSVLNNIALAEFKLGEHTAAIGHCNEALAIDESNVKALIRLGQSYAAMAEWSSADEAYKRALVADTASGTATNTADIKKLQAQIAAKTRCGTSEGARGIRWFFW